MAAVPHKPLNDFNLLFDETLVSFPGITVIVFPGPFATMALFGFGSFSEEFEGGFPQVHLDDSGRITICHHHHKAAEAITKLDERENGWLAVRFEKIFKRNLKSEGEKVVGMAGTRKNGGATSILGILQKPGLDSLGGFDEVFLTLTIVGAVSGPDPIGKLFNDQFSSIG